MNFNLGLTFSGMVYILLIIIIYFKRKRIKSKENKIYSLLLISTFVELLLGMVSYILIINIENMAYITRIINVLYLISLDSWILFFMLYVISISSDFKSKKLYKIFWVVYVLIAFLISILPIDYYYKNNIMYTNGLAVNFTYLIAIIAILVIVINSIVNIKKLGNKKYIPMFIFLLFGGIALFLQIKYPELFLISPLEVLVTVVMYFTIENPDMKTIEEIHKAKEISDNANEEKTMFLYNMTNEIRNITKDIDYSADDILDETSNKKVDVEVINDAAREIKGSTAKFTTMTNEILDINSIDSASIKVYNDKYNVKLIIKELVTVYSKKCNVKNIDFRPSIASDIPEYLYGDSVGLKQVLDIILDNSVKYTSSGYIEFNVNTIIKNNIARLIITVEDSGTGMKAEDIIKVFNKKNDRNEDSLNLNNNLYNAKALITLMGGTIIPSSIYGTGTKMKIILDQRLVVSDSKLNEYEKVIDKKDVLLIGNLNSKIIKDIVKDKNINLEIIELGKEALDKIRGKKKYDLILIEDNIKPLSGIIIMKKLLMIKSFNTKVILLSSNNEYIDNYDKYGFSDVISEPIDEDIFIKISPSNVNYIIKYIFERYPY